MFIFQQIEDLYESLKPASFANLVEKFCVSQIDKYVVYK